MRYPLPKNTIIIPLLLLTSIWLTFMLQLQGLGNNYCYGIIPRNLSGLKGIILAPLLHSDWQHIFNNSIALAVLSFFAVLFYNRLAYFVILFGWIFTGILVWLFGNLPFIDDSVGCHIGASGVVYVLASFLFFSGILRKSRNLIALSLIVVFFYGSMVWGIFPEEFLPQKINENSNPISWESHLAGAIVGLAFAFILKKKGPQRKTYLWENENYKDPQAEALWEAYLKSLEPTKEEE